MNKNDLIKLKEVAKVLIKAKPKIELSLPESTYTNPDRLLQVMSSEFRRTPKLLDCSHESIQGAMMLAARLGLEPDNALGHFYILPYGRTAQIIIGYKGLIELALRSPHVKSIYAREVYEGDSFEVKLGTETEIVHEPSIEPKMVDGKIVPKELIAVYAVAKLENGSTEVEVMAKHEVDVIRKRSKSGNSGPWVTDYSAMARKTVLRRMCKYIPMAVDAQKASVVEEDIETGRDVIDTFDSDIIDAETGEVITEEKQEANVISSLKDKLKAK